MTHEVQRSEYLSKRLDISAEGQPPADPYNPRFYIRPYGRAGGSPPLQLTIRIRVRKCQKSNTSNQNEDSDRAPTKIRGWIGGAKPSSACSFIGVSTASPQGVWKGEHIPGIGEWIMLRAEIPIAEYEQLAPQFNPVKYDADQIVKLAKAAGQKYIVLTSKHHDGFCLYGSKETNYNIVDGTPFGRDVLGELAEACAREGIKLGLYYSQTQDWHHPNGFGNTWDFNEDEQDFGDYIDNYVKPQVREILTNYGPICIIWFDTPRIIERHQSQELLDLVHSIQPDCLVCGRLGNKLGDYATAQDNAIPPDLQAEIDWETPATINDTWGFKTHDHNWKSTTQLIQNLVDIVSKGGNYLLNIGPDAAGAIPEPSVERLEAMGAWLDVNGESIYGTQPGPDSGPRFVSYDAEGRYGLLAGLRLAPKRANGIA